MKATKKKTPPKGGRSHASSRPSNRKKTRAKSTPDGLNRASALKAWVADLKKSCMTLADAKKRGYKLLTPKQTQERTKNAKYKGAYVWSYLIPYFDIDRKRVKDYWRVRYLEDVLGPFGRKPKKPWRYSGPKDARIRIYFDPTVDYSPIRSTD